MNKAYIGIDPGMRGAIACISYIDGGDEEVSVFPIPTHKKEIDVPTLRNLINNIIWNLDWNYDPENYELISYIENVWKPNSLVKIAGILEGLTLWYVDSVNHVSPSTWRKEILGNKNATKEDAINYCMEHFSGVSLLRTKRSRIQDHNLAEALCIAEYAKRKHFVSD